MEEDVRPAASFISKSSATRATTSQTREFGSQFASSGRGAILPKPRECRFKSRVSGALLSSRAFAAIVD